MRKESPSARPTRPSVRITFDYKGARERADSPTSPDSASELLPGAVVRRRTPSSRVQVNPLEADSIVPHAPFEAKPGSQRLRPLRVMVDKGPVQEEDYSPSVSRISSTSSSRLSQVSRSTQEIAGEAPEALVEFCREHPIPLLTEELHYLHCYSDAELQAMHSQYSDLKNHYQRRLKACDQAQRGKYAAGYLSQKITLLNNYLAEINRFYPRIETELQARKNHMVLVVLHQMLDAWQYAFFTDRRDTPFAIEVNTICQSTTKNSCAAGIEYTKKALIVGVSIVSSLEAVLFRGEHMGAREYSPAQKRDNYYKTWRPSLLFKPEISDGLFNRAARNEQLEQSNLERFAYVYVLKMLGGLIHYPEIVVRPFLRVALTLVNGALLAPLHVFAQVALGYGLQDYVNYYMRPNQPLLQASEEDPAALQNFIADVAKEQRRLAANI